MKRKSNFDVTPEQYAMMKQAAVPPAPHLLTTGNVALPSFLQLPPQLPASFLHDERYQAKLDAALKRSFDYVRRLDAIAAGLIPEPAVVAPPAFSKQFRQMHRPLPSRARPGIGSTPQRVNELQATSVYVNGLPLHFTNTQLESVFSAYGKVTRCKFYKDAEGKPKGDALVTFAKPMSAANACKMDGFAITPENTISVTPANFSRKQQEDAAKLPPECEADSFPVVLFRNMYIAAEAQSDPNFFVELEADLLEACVKFGKIRRIVSPEGESFEGTIAVTFAEENAAKTCAEAMAGRYFDGHQIEAEFIGRCASSPMQGGNAKPTTTDATQAQQPPSQQLQLLSESAPVTGSAERTDVAPPLLAGAVVMAAAPPDVRNLHEQQEQASGDPLAAFLESIGELEKSIL